MKKKLKTKRIYVFGEVNSELSLEVCSDFHETNWNTYDELEIYINSEGGGLYDCFSILDLVTEVKDKYKIKVSTIGLGCVASAGFYIFILGDKRILTPKARVFVHEHITISGEQTYGERLKSDKEDEKRVYDTYLSYTAERLGICKAKAANLLKKNNWLTLKDIHTYKLITES